MLTLASVKANPAILAYINKTGEYLTTLGFTDHGLRHATIVSDRANELGGRIGLPARTRELARIAGFCHDMGNFLDRDQHYVWGAFLFNQVFSDPADITDVTRIMQAIVQHDTPHLKLVDPITALLIVADKSDVHRSRVAKRSLQQIHGDIHDRVNYSVTDNRLTVDRRKKLIVLTLNVDTKFTPIMEYFEIFTERMVYCRRAAKAVGYKFGLVINHFTLL